MAYQPQPSVKLADSPFIDAFDRLRVSELFGLFDSKMLADKSPLYWDEVLNGTGASTHSVVDAAVTMSVVGNGDYVIRQTKMRMNYQPGRSQLNPTLSGDIFTAPFIPIGSAVEIGRTPTGGAGNITVTGAGLVIASGVAAAQTSSTVASLDNAIRLGVSIAGERDVLALCIQQFAPAGEDYYAAINWRELL